MKLVVLFILSLMLCANVHANTSAGYTMVNSATGWKIWKKEANGATIYVQEIDITKRELRFVHNTPNKDVFPRFILKDKYSSSIVSMLSLSNGAFFEDTSTPTTGLSYGYKVGQITYTHGWSTQRDYSSLRMLAYNNTLPFAKSVKVVQYSKSEFDLPSTQNALVGLSPYYNADDKAWSKRSTSKLGRTFVGVKGNILFILNTDKMIQNNARLELFNNFGVDNNNIIMFDGANSTQLSFKGQQDDFIGCGSESVCRVPFTWREVPQGIAVF